MELHRVAQMVGAGSSDDGEEVAIQIADTEGRHLQIAVTHAGFAQWMQGWFTALSDAQTKRNGPPAIHVFRTYGFEVLPDPGAHRVLLRLDIQESGRGPVFLNFPLGSADSLVLARQLDQAAQESDAATGSGRPN